MKITNKLKQFIDVLTDAGCDKFIIHARKAWLNGLSPKENRTIPPLHYDYVYRMKSELSHPIPVVINGHIETLAAINAHLGVLDGVMIGRLACRHPYVIAQHHHALYPDTPKITRSEAFKAYFEYMITQPDVPMSILLKPILNLIAGLPRARDFKQDLLAIKQLPNEAMISNLLQKLEGIERAFNGFSSVILVN